MIGAKVLFNFADGSFWHRHVNVRFPPIGAPGHGAGRRSSSLKAAARHSSIAGG
ncbi:MAG: hypothetical protein ACHQK9_24785 [Reyranellales bacterium]